MTQWIERINNHRVWQLLRKLRPEIDRALKCTDIDPTSIEILARLKVIISFAGNHLPVVDPYLFQLAPVDNLSNTLEALIKELQHFILNGDTLHIRNANAHVDVILDFLVRLNIIATEKFAELYRSGLEGALLDFRNTAPSTQDEFESLLARIAKLSSKLTAQRIRLTEVLTDFHAQFSATQKTRSCLEICDRHVGHGEEAYAGPDGKSHLSIFDLLLNLKQVRSSMTDCIKVAKS
ncbi:MAG TPA: hypothetical protein VEF33_10235 [Syntrophales bacterium]|nr:hypothetical protein [Syntrophales bacterium]